MQLSEAIRLGSMLSGQAFGGLRIGSSTCAMGAAYEAIGLGTSDDNMMARNLKRDELWPFLLDTRGVCPDCGEDSGLVLHVIAEHLNDTHRWTRERIADYIAATFEQPAADAELAAHILSGCTITIDAERQAEYERQDRAIALLKAAAPEVCNLDMEDLGHLAEVLHG